MYLAYQPRNSFQGLPPLRDEICVRWVQDMIRDGINIVVLDAHGQIDGHTGLFPINTRKCELLVVVTPGRQNMGLGTELVRACIAAAAELGKACEITRFKGLGEISPREFKQFISDDMRLSQVEYAPKPDTQTILGFYMGKNTPERKDYIMENLVVPVEE